MMNLKDEFKIHNYSISLCLFHHLCRDPKLHLFGNFIQSQEKTQLEIRNLVFFNFCIYLEKKNLTWKSIERIFLTNFHLFEMPITTQRKKM